MSSVVPFPEPGLDANAPGLNEPNAPTASQSDSPSPPTKRPLTLKARLLLALGLLLAVGIIVCSTAAVAVLRSYLLGQIDVRLEDARSEVIQQFADPTRDPYSRTSINLSDFYINVLEADGTQTSSGPEPDYKFTPDISASEAVRAANGDIFTATSRQDRTYRFRTIILQPSSGSEMLVLAIPTGSVNATISRLALIDGLAMVVVLIVLIGAGYVIIRRDLAPLEEMTDTAGAIGAGDLTRRVAHSDEHSEVGRLGKALNAMLSQIEASFAERQASEDRLRRFAADASHELRTPLTAVRGYAELYRQGAVVDPEHIARVMARIETEATRMGVMVEDLLLLARLDQGRPLETTVVDMADIIRNAVSDASVIAPDRSLSTEIEGAPLLVDGDANRLHQVLTNLIANALTHTPATAAVTVSGQRVGNVIEVKVIDTGQGMDEEAAANIFERFYRVDAGRARSQGGTGLGLAIVDAIVRTHHGTVDVVTSPGNGATFTVSLPCAHPPELGKSDPLAPLPSAGEPT